ncbi:MAG TPA: transglutaminase family protein [Bryobacteraceae bacterium]|nr:transglutaminase family protein [Bryobacteraceae bacterium]
MNRYRLVHVTEFSYDGPVTESYNEVRLRPLQDELQSCLSFRLSTDPNSRVSSSTDYFGNVVHRFNVLAEHRRLRVEADSVVLVQAPALFPSGGPELGELEQIASDLDEHYELLASTEYVPHAPQLRDLVDTAERNCDGTMANYALAASDVVHDTFRYEQGATHVHSSIRDAIATRAGVCQDFAHILLALLRMRGLPGRYVSGYLVPRRTAEPGASVEEIIGGQASHAWAEVFLPTFGWAALDPTLGQLVGLQHVRIAYGRDYGDVAPVRGVYKGHAGQQLSVDVRVRPALDDEGTEHLEETCAAPSQPQIDTLPQQHQQQQQ